MRVISVAFFVLLFSSLTFSQLKVQPTDAKERQAALEKFNNLKATAADLENVVLAPEKQDFEEAKKENAEVLRILPREIYDNSFSSIRGGGSYYSFYFRIPDYDHGTDIGLEKSLLSTGLSGFGVMAD